MAIQVPQYKQQVPMSEGSNFRKPVVAGPDAFGANVAEATGKAAGAAFDIAVKQREESDAKAVLDATDAYKKDLMDAFYNQERGFMRKMGDNAEGTEILANDYLNRSRQKYEGMLTNERQLQIFRQNVYPTENAYMLDARNHEYKQREVAFTARIEAGIETDRQSAIYTFDKPDSANVHLSSMAQKVTIAGLRAGLDKDTIAQKIKLEHSKTVASMFDYAINEGNLPGAKAVIDTWGSIINPDVKGKKDEIYQKKAEDNSFYSIMKEAENNPAYKGENGLFSKDLAMKDFESKTRTIKSGSVSGDSIISQGNKQKGKPYKLGGDGKESTDCGKFVQDTFEGVGINVPTRTADGQALWVEKNGGWFTDQKQLKKGDLVFYKNTYGNFTASDNPAAVNSSTEAYKGITHVGIYDGAGGVLQAGSKGVGTIPLNSGMEIAGYGHAPEIGEEKIVPLYSGAQLLRLSQMFKALENEQREKRNRAENEAFGNLLDYLGANADNPTLQIAAIDAYNDGTPGRSKKSAALKKQILNPIEKAARAEKQDIATSILTNSYNNGTLTTEQVDEFAPFFSSSKELRTWIEKARGAERKTSETINDNVDKDWIRELTAKYSLLKVPEKQIHAMIGATTRILNNNGINGLDRAKYVRDKMNNDPEFKTRMMNYEQADQTQWDNLWSVYDDPRIRRCVEKSWPRNNDPAYKPDAGAVNELLTRIGKLINAGDKPTEIAWEDTINKELPLNATLFWAKRNELAKLMGLEPIEMGLSVNR